jgi:hypothetical protein
VALKMKLKIIYDFEAGKHAVSIKGEVGIPPKRMDDCC